MKKILCTGGSGQLGSELKALFKSLNLKDFDIEFPDRLELDLSDPKKIESFLSQKNYDFIILSGAYTKVDLAEEEKELCLRINGENQKVFCDYTQKNNTTLIYLSTDYVYNGKSGQLIETDATEPINIYGLSKLKGEEYVAQTKAYYTIRTSWVYSAYGHNFLKTMLNLAQKHNQLSVVNDQIGTPTYAGHLAELILQIIVSDKSPEALPYGTYNYSDEGVASWYDFAHYIFELSKKDITLTPVGSDQYPTKAKRPSNSLMSKDKIRSWSRNNLTHWHNGVKKCLKNLNNEQL